MKSEKKPIEIDTYAEREEKRFKINQKIKTMKKGFASSSFENKSLLLEELNLILRILRFDDIVELLPVLQTF